MLFNLKSWYIWKDKKIIADHKIFPVKQKTTLFKFFWNDMNCKVLVKKSTAYSKFIYIFIIKSHNNLKEISFASKLGHTLKIKL